MEFNHERPGSIRLLFSNYLAHKIDDGYFPKGTLLPSSADFMMVFRLKLPDVLGALVALEERGMVKIVGNAMAEVIAGNTAVQSAPLDIRKDISKIFEHSEKLEHMALDKAWAKIDQESMKDILSTKGAENHSQWIWQANMAIHSQIVDNCGDMALCLHLANFNEQLEFFRKLYLDTISEGRILDHVFMIESIVCAFIFCDLEDVHLQLSAYFATIQENLLDFFNEKYIILPKT